MEKIKVPHVYVIVGIIIVLAVFLTYILPAGTYERYVDKDTGRTLVQAGSYKLIESSPVGLFGTLQSIPKGMMAAASVIFIVFIFGGSFGVINSTGAIESGIENSLGKAKDLSFIFIPVFMILFGVMGGFLGMIDCLIVFVPICITLSRALGYDAMTGFAMLQVGNITGFTIGPMCMWNTGVAQGIAELPLFSALEFRLILFAIFMTVGIAYVMRYAAKVKKDSTSSVVYALELEHHKRHEEQAKIATEFTTRKKLVLAAVALGFLGLIAGVLKGWSTGTQIAGYMLGLALVVGLIDGKSFNEIAEGFVQGARDVVMGALVIGLARAILVVLTEGNIVDTILYGAATFLGNFTPTIGVMVMFGFQFFFNFIVYSGSGQAATTMPLMVPLADLVGITRQTSVIAFQFGDGLSNALWPTAGPLMAGLSMAKIGYSTWVRWLMPLIVIQCIMACITLVICVAIKLGPF